MHHAHVVQSSGHPQNIALYVVEATMEGKPKGELLHVVHTLRVQCMVFAVLENIGPLFSSFFQPSMKLLGEMGLSMGPKFSVE